VVVVVDWWSGGGGLGANWRLQLLCFFRSTPVAFLGQILGESRKKKTGQ
jgi:hypothetical protein